LVFILHCYHESHSGELFLKHSVETPEQQRFTTRSYVYWPALTVGIARRMARTNGLWTHRSSSTDPPMLQPSTRRVLQQRLF